MGRGHQVPWRVLDEVPSTGCEAQQVSAPSNGIGARRGYKVTENVLGCARHRVRGVTDSRDPLAHA